MPKNIVENAENNCERNSVMKKIHRTNLLSKIISFMLAFVMMVCMLVPVGYADSPDEYVTDDEEEIVIVPFELPLLPGDLTPEEAKDAVLDMTTVPACISAENVEEQKHIKRLYEQEPDDYTIMFQNRDLSKTTYVFSVPVKNNGYPGGHYVAVVGYDSITDRVLIADCSCFTKYFGLYMKSMQTVYNASFSAFLE